MFNRVPCKFFYDQECILTIKYFVNKLIKNFSLLYTSQQVSLYPQTMNYNTSLMSNLFLYCKRFGAYFDWKIKLCRIVNNKDGSKMSFVSNKSAKKDNRFSKHYLKGKYDRTYCASILFVWFHLICLCWMNNRFTCLVKSKPVQQEVCCTVILPPIVSVLWTIARTSFFTCAPTC